MSSAGKEAQRITRKQFLKGTTAGAVGGFVASAAAVPGVALGQEESKPWLPAKWDKETDVVVVGAAGAGLAAAIEAKAAGAEVLIIEKSDHVGGLFIAAGGHAIMGATHVHEREGIEDHLEWWYEDEMKASDYRAVPEMVRTYVEKGPETVKWMEDLGLFWMIRQASLSFGHRVNRSLNASVSPEDPEARGFGWDWIRVLKREAERLGIPPALLNHRMTRIYREPNGPVVGIEVETKEGTINIKARKAVILTSGGTVDNTRMCMAQDPRFGPEEDIMGDTGGQPGSGGAYNENVGDGHLAALAIGADVTDMSSYVSFLAFRLGSKPYWVWEPRDWDNPPMKRGTGLGGVTGDGLQRVIWVKADGKRYVNEALGAQVIERSVGIDPYAPNRMEGLSEGALPHEYPEHPFMRALLNLPERPRNVWVVTDAEGAEAIGWPEETMRNPNPLESPALYPDSVAVADTIEELAEKMGMDPEGLEETITRYNGFVDAGEDEDFGKPLPLFKIAKPPYFAAKANLLRHTQPGGLRINTKAQIIERADQFDGHHAVSIDEEKVIPHLYAAGECTGFLGWRRNHGRLGNCVTFGRIAGQNAAKEKSLA